MHLIDFATRLFSFRYSAQQKWHFSTTWVATVAVWAVATNSPAAMIPAGVQLHAKQEMIRNIGAESETLDPALVESVVAYQITSDLFEGLTATTTAGEVVPGVAQSWKQTDPVTWVFTLRRNAKFSNDDPITADDFIYAWRRFLDPKTASHNATTFASFLLNGLRINEGKAPVTDLGVRAIDKYTLEVKTTGPVNFLPELLTSPQLAPVSKKVIEAFGRDWTKPGNLVGNGAYLLSDWRVNNKVVVEKNPKYWDAAAVIVTKVTYLGIEDGNADVKLFQSGENDWVEQLPPGSYESFKRTHPKEVKNGPLLGLRYYTLNFKDPLIQDVRIRKALSMVIDRDILSSRVTADGQPPLYGLVVQGLHGADMARYDWADWSMERKVTEARKLLADAGVKPGTRIRLMYNTSEYHKKMSIFAASEWKTKLGLETELDSLEFKVLLRKRHDGDYQIARDGLVAAYNDVTSLLSIVQCDADFNDSKSCNRAAEKLIVEGKSQTDQFKRRALLSQAIKLIMDEYPIIPLLQYSQPRLVKSYVGGYYESNVKSNFRSKDLYIIRH
jgi:oligopeptide transport system substrate-binding protein